jgi:outer membrane protein TolC
MNYIIINQLSKIKLSPGCIFTHFLSAVLLLINAQAYAQGKSETLSLSDAEQLALMSAPTVERFIAVSRALDDVAVADDRLPDPKLRLGAVNLPVDTFDYKQEQMTQLKIGVQQNFPRGDSLAYKQQQSQLLSKSAQAKADDARLKLLREVRENFLNLYFQVKAYELLRETRKLFSELLRITESNYASGRSTQQDVLLASLEMSRLDDRAEKILTEQERYQSRLVRWVGEGATLPLDPSFPLVPDVPESIDINQILTSHPLIRSQDAGIEATKKQAEIAEQEYAPGWSLILDYGYRAGENPDGTERADFATALVSLDIPMFNDEQIKRNVSASHKRTAEAQFVKDDQLRELKQMLEQNQRIMKRLNERTHLYEKKLLKAAESNTNAARNAYQSGVSEFDTLMRAQITELDVKLEHLRLRVDREITRARLLYVTGENDHESK